MQAARQATPPKLRTDCHTPALRLSDTSARAGALVTWSATGPAGRYVLTVDSAAVRRMADGSIDPVGGATAARAGKPYQMTGCKASGRFSFALGVGTYELRMLRLDGADGRVVLMQQITVTAS